MDQFPQELFDHICSYLSAEDLRNTYYVSTKFRKAAEDHAEEYRTDFYEMSKEDDLNKFIGHHSGFCLRYLKHVHFNVCFPELDAEDRGCRESAEEQYRKDKIFTEQVRMIFEVLKVVEEQAGERNRGKYQLTICINAHVDEYCLHRQQSQWRTHLLEPEALPVLKSVDSLHVTNDTSSAKLDYRVMIDLAKRLPSLKYLECHFGQNEWTPSYPDEPASLFLWEYDGPRRDTRHDFGKAIILTDLPGSLREVQLDFLCREAMLYADRINHWKAMPNLVSPLSRDPFSSSLRVLSYHLQEMTLRAQVDDTLFWPIDGTTPCWPNLQYIFIMFHMVSPSGAWYFEGPRGEGRESTGYEVNDTSYPPLETTEDDEVSECQEVESDRSFEDRGQFCFRISPNDNVLGPFLASFAKAAARMPELKRAVIWSPLRWIVDLDDDEGPKFNYFQPPEKLYQDYSAWGFAYDAPMSAYPFATNPGEPNCEARQIWWKVGEWRPSEELHNLFQQIGCQKHGNALKEHWKDDEFGQGLVSRDYFERFTPEDYD
jgi:hypothetical protein